MQKWSTHLQSKVELEHLGKLRNVCCKNLFCRVFEHGLCRHACLFKNVAETQFLGADLNPNPEEINHSVGLRVMICVREKVCCLKLQSKGLIITELSLWRLIPWSLKRVKICNRAGQILQWEQCEWKIWEQRLHSPAVSIFTLKMSSTAWTLA